MNEPSGHHAEREMPGTEGHRGHDCSYLKHCEEPDSESGSRVGIP